MNWIAIGAQLAIGAVLAYVFLVFLLALIAGVFGE